VARAWPGVSWTAAIRLPPGHVAATGDTRCQAACRPLGSSRQGTSPREKGLVDAFHLTKRRHISYKRIPQVFTAEIESDAHIVTAIGGRGMTASTGFTNAHIFPTPASLRGTAEYGARPVCSPAAERLAMEPEGFQPALSVVPDDRCHRTAVRTSYHNIQVTPRPAHLL
jgi:hypothetical protein